MDEARRNVEPVGTKRAARRMYINTPRVDGTVKRIDVAQLRWVWRPTFTSQVASEAAFRFPVSLVLAQRAEGLRLKCGYCSRAGTARLYRTSERRTWDIFFTKCRRCLRTWRIATLPLYAPSTQVPPKNYPRWHYGREPVPGWKTVVVASVAIAVVVILVLAANGIL